MRWFIFSVLFMGVTAAEPLTIPAGASAEGKLVTGADLPLSRTSQSAAVLIELGPVTIAAEDGHVMTLAPASRAQGVWHPEGSSERARIDVRRLTWIENNGIVREVAVCGYVTDKAPSPMQGVPGTFKTNLDKAMAVFQAAQGHQAEVTQAVPTLEVQAQPLRVVFLAVEPKSALDQAPQLIRKIPEGSYAATLRTGISVSSDAAVPVLLDVSLRIDGETIDRRSYVSGVAIVRGERIEITAQRISMVMANERFINAVVHGSAAEATSVIGTPAPSSATPAALVTVAPTVLVSAGTAMTLVIKTPITIR